MSADLEHLGTLVNDALARGAARAAIIRADNVVTDIRVRMKCQVPLCKNYGRSLMCPPFTMLPQDMAAVLAKYSYAILVQWTFRPVDEKLREMEDRSFAEMENDLDYERTIKAAFKEMTRQLNVLEGEALKMGYRFATAFSGGPCSLCPECVGPGGACRHPFSARPSMEAVGIDVIATCENGGLPIKYPAEGEAMLTGLLLVD